MNLEILMYCGFIYVCGENFWWLKSGCIFLILDFVVLPKNVYILLVFLKCVSYWKFSIMNCLCPFNPCTLVSYSYQWTHGIWNFIYKKIWEKIYFIRFPLYISEYRINMIKWTRNILVNEFINDSISQKTKC